MSTITSRTHAWWSPTNKIAYGGAATTTKKKAKPKKDIQKMAADDRNSGKKVKD